MKTVKMSITIPEDLLEQIKNLTDNVSAFITEGMRQYVSKENLRRALEAGAGAWKKENHPELSSIQEINDFVRKTRSEWRKQHE